MIAIILAPELHHQSPVPKPIAESLSGLIERVTFFNERISMFLLKSRGAEPMPKRTRLPARLSAAPLKRMESRCWRGQNRLAGPSAEDCYLSIVLKAP